MKKLLAILASVFAALVAINATAMASASIVGPPATYTQVSSPPNGANGAPWLFGAAWPREAAPYGFCWTAGDARNADGSAGAGVIYHDWDKVNVCGTSAWTKDSPPAGDGDFGYNSISCPSTGFCVVVGGARTILRNTHAGTSGTLWSLVNRSAGQDLEGVSCPDSVHCVAVGTNGTVLYSTNSAATFLVGTSGTAENLFGVFCSSSTQCIATGSNGKIIRSTNGGANWSSAVSGAGAGVAVNGGSCYSISCYAAGDSTGGPAYLGYSTNGGSSWILTGTNPTNQTLLGVDCRDQNNCSAAGSVGQIYSTHNGGSVWVLDVMSPTTTLQLSAVGCSLTAIQCIVVGQSGLVYRG